MQRSTGGEGNVEVCLWVSYTVYIQLVATASGGEGNSGKEEVQCVNGARHSSTLSYHSNRYGWF